MAGFGKRQQLAEGALDKLIYSYYYMPILIILYRMVRKELSQGNMVTTSLSHPEKEVYHA